MSALRLFVSLVRWDLLREIRRRETVINMTVFAVLVLFLGQLGLGPLADELLRRPDRHGQVLGGSLGPVLFWISLLFAGTVGLNQSLAAEREGGVITGIQLAPFDLGVFYLAKVGATWIYVMLMEVLLLSAYVVLFNFTDWGRLPPLLGVMGLFTLGYIAPGVVLAAMTTTLRSGDVLLRILLFPLLMPLVYFTLRVKAATFGVETAAAAGIDPVAYREYLAIIAAFDTIYLTTGFLVFPKVLEE